MNSNPKLSFAIAAILSGSGMGVGIAHAADADSEGIPEIQVTAQRRSESIQDVPITIQALSGDMLKTLNVQTFDDLLKYTPNVTYSGNNPGGGNIYMRGLSSGGTPGQSQSTTAPFPNVGVYLDDQSMQYPARNVDVYLVDMERVEILEGPQGTLFGGGAQAGAIRYITNKPKLDVTEGNVDASYGITARGGDPNSAITATLNLPLISDTLAVRATIFDDHRGGYISNVPGTITIPAALCPAGTVCPTASNAALVGKNENPLTYTGVRLEALLKINEDWNILLAQNYQNMQADGYWGEYPVSTNGTALSPYQIDAFTPAYNKDKYESTAWTVSGNIETIPAIGDLKLVYTGSYLVRHIQQQNEYSNYLTSGAGSLYDCTGAGASYFKTAKPTTCYAPVGAWNDVVTNDHQSHEIRLTTSEANRFRATVGGFWEDFVIHDEMNFNYLPIPQCDAANLAISAAGGPDCLSAVGPIPGNYANDPSVRQGTNTAFGEDVKRGYRQTAAFLSGDFDIIPKVLTVTAGTRYFHYDEFEQGSEFYSETTSPLIYNHPNGACVQGGACGFGINLNKQEHGFKSRFNLTYHVLPDVLAYYTYSQGFRPGGFNRTHSLADGTDFLKGEADYTAGVKATQQYVKPAGYGSDNLINQELGFKSEFFEHRLQANLSLYRMNWSDVQILLFDPTHLGNTQFAVNGPTYVVKGVELQLVGRVTEGLTIQGSSSWNSSNQTNAPCLESTKVSATNPTPLGTCITQINGQPYTNPFGVLDTSPAYSPPVQFNIRARYDIQLADYKPFISVGANHIGSMRNEPASYVSGELAAPAGCLVNGAPNTTLCKYVMPGYTTYDASIGVVKDHWTAQFTGNNLSNSDASTNTNSGQFIKSEVPLRPRVLTFSFGYKF